LQQPAAKEGLLARTLPPDPPGGPTPATHGGEPAAEPAPAPPPRPLDEVDRAILRVLRDDGRISMIELAERVGVSRGSASTRFERLRRDGVIEGFSARLAPRRLGLTAAAFVNLRVEQGAWRKVREALLAIPQVEQVSLVTGGSDFVVLVRAADVDSLRDLVLDRLRRVPGVRSTFTTVILDDSTRGPALP
jgi:DNA-binding Lrp family transcriptional regulator